MRFDLYRRLGTGLALGMLVVLGVGAGLVMGGSVVIGAAALLGAHAHATEYELYPDVFYDNVAHSESPGSLDI
jgi:hypothetical protein